MESNYKNSFETIKDYKNDIDNVFRYIKNKTEILTCMYNDYLKEIKDTINYRISLDSFNFQTKLINIEHDNYNKIFKLFINRMYGDYYKLYNKLIDYVKNNVKNVKIVNDNQYPKYKDLEVNIEYNIEIIDNVYSNILSILTELTNYCLKENHLIKEIKKKQNNGININNFLNEKKYSVIILEQKINFYYETLKGYIESQKKFFKRLYLKLKLIYAQLCHDINLETSINKNNSSLNKINSFSSDSNLSNQHEEYYNYSLNNSSENLFESCIENELDKHFKLIDTNENFKQITKQKIIQQVNEESGKESSKELGKESSKELSKESGKESGKESSKESGKESSTRQNKQHMYSAEQIQESEEESQERSDEDESTDSVEYMKFF